MNREEAKKRRRQIAESMRKKKNIQAVAEEFKVSSQLVRKACHEFEVVIPRAKPASLPLEKIAADLRTGTSQTKLATLHQVPVEKIHQAQAELAGGIPARKKRSRS